MSIPEALASGPAPDAETLESASLLDLYEARDLAAQFHYRGRQRKIEAEISRRVVLAHQGCASDNGAH